MHLSLPGKEWSKKSKSNRWLSLKQNCEKATKPSSESSLEDSSQSMVPVDIDKLSTQLIGIYKDKYIPPERQQQIINEI